MRLPLLVKEYWRLKSHQWSRSVNFKVIGIGGTFPSIRKVMHHISAPVTC